MSDSAIPQESVIDSAGEGVVPARDDPPRFGVVDMVEAFTAMRHEWRGQTIESRALGERIAAAVANLQSLEAKLLARQAEHGTDASPARQLIQLIVETDHQLTRAVAAIRQWEGNQQVLAEAHANGVERCVAGMNAVARWFARPLLKCLAEQRRDPGAAAENPAATGLDLVLARLRREMHELGIERLDVEGLEFDADTMRALGAVESADCPAGHVVEQLSPAYRWQGQLLRFAEVWVAK